MAEKQSKFRTLALVLVALLLGGIYLNQHLLEGVMENVSARIDQVFMGLNKENAAIYYLDAIEVARLPLIKNFDSYVADTIRNTPDSDPKLGKMIIENTIAFNKLTVANQFKTCDFNFDENG